MSKRRRTEGDGAEGESPDATGASSTITPVLQSDIWTDDGNVVLQVENTQFKVHRSVLARVSTIFADVFSIPQPPEGDDVVDGCPLVHLQDSAQDVQYLLSILYDHRYITKELIPFDACAAMVRMGKKYDIEFLLQEGLRRLKLAFATSLSSWDASWASGGCWAVFENLDRPDLHRPRVFKLIDFAVSFNVPETRFMLPTLYFLCNLLRIVTIVAGRSVSGPEGVVGDSPPLPLETQLIVLSGRERLIARLQHTFSWIDKLGELDECSNVLQCPKTARGLSSCLWRPEPQIYFLLETWEYLEGRFNLTNRLCQECYRMAQASHARGRQETWNQLPSYFNLPAWNVLNAAHST